MKNFLVFVLVAFTRLVNAQNCNVKQCVQMTFDVDHINWWKISNSVDGKFVNDSFSFVEAAIGDTSFNNFNGGVSVFISPKLTLITELEDRSIYVISKSVRSAATKRQSSAIKLDSIAGYFMLDQSIDIDSIGPNTYQMLYNGNLVRLRIRPEICLIESIEMLLQETQEGSDNNGFYSEKNVIRSVVYTLQNSEHLGARIKGFIEDNTYVEVQNNTSRIKEAYRKYGFTIENLNEQ